jgi:molybdopterin synthase sulfur carrier subunit
MAAGFGLAQIHRSCVKAALITSIDHVTSSTFALPFVFSVHVVRFIFFCMAIKVLIPTPLQKLTNNQATFECEGDTIAQLLESLEQSFPGIKARLCDDNGELRRFVNFYVNNEDIRFLSGANTKLQNGDEVSIIPAIAGG